MSTPIVQANSIQHRSRGLGRMATRKQQNHRWSGKTLTPMPQVTAMEHRSLLGLEMDTIESQSCYGPGIPNLSCI